MKILVIGTFDSRFGRNRQLLRLLKSAGYRCDVRSFSIWTGDKAAAVQRKKFQTIVGSIVQYLRIVGVIVRARITRRYDAVLVPHPSQIDALVIGTLCRLLRLPLAIDFFISLHETVVEDRQLVSSTSLIGKMLKKCDTWAVRLSTVVITDTPEDAQHFATVTRSPTSKWHVVWVGADPDVYVPNDDVQPESHTVLFYGTYIPLQGIEHIVHAVALLPDHFMVKLIGNGQQRPFIEDLIHRTSAKIELIDSVSENELAQHIASSSVCLGVFGEGNKTARVIPNKVFQCLAMGRPVITGDTPAISHLDDGVCRVPVANPDALADAIKRLVGNDEERQALARRGREIFVRDFTDTELVTQIKKAMLKMTETTGSVAPLTIMARLREPFISSFVARTSPQTVLEVGAGQGAMGTRLARHATYVGLEPDTSSGSIARERLSTHANADFRLGGIEQLRPDESFDMICAFEVLEHIEDDVSALRAWSQHLRTDGHLLVSFPAHQGRFGPSDRAVGHFRRYDTPDIGELFSSAGLEVVEQRAYGAIGGHALEWFRNLVLSRRDGGSHEHDARDTHEKTAASGRLFQPSSRVGGLATALIALPLRLLQTPFSRSSFGVGWVVAARKRGMV
jgi:glycosyltransferase involved in cell wall biosynthesis